MNSFCQRITGSAAFQRAITSIIVFSGVLVGMETDAGIVTHWGPWLRFADWCVVGIFVVELALRLGAHGREPWRFFRDGWNVFDFVIVALCLLPAAGPFAAVLRLARVLRLLRLVSALPKLQLLVGALLKSLGAMGYVALLLGLLSYIYAVAGVNLFGVDAPQFFGSLGAALHSLLRVITLDNWTEIFVATEQGAPLFAVFYFVSFILLGTMIMLNLFIGIIMNSMSAMHAEMENRERAAHIRATGRTTTADELILLERQLEELKDGVARVRSRLQGPATPARRKAPRELESVG